MRRTEVSGMARQGCFSWSASVRRRRRSGDTPTRILQEVPVRQEGAVGQPQHQVPGGVIMNYESFMEPTDQLTHLFAKCKWSYFILW